MGRFCPLRVSHDTYTPLGKNCQGEALCSGLGMPYECCPRNISTSFEKHQANPSPKVGVLYPGRPPFSGILERSYLLKYLAYLTRSRVGGKLLTPSIRVLTAFVKTTKNWAAYGPPKMGMLWGCFARGGFPMAPTRRSGRFATERPCVLVSVCLMDAVH